MNDHDTASNQGDAGIDNFLDFPLTQYIAVGPEATATCDASDFNITSDSENDSCDYIYVDTVDSAAVQYRADRSDGSTDTDDQLNSTSEFERPSSEDEAVQYRIVRSGLDDLKGLTDNDSVVQDGSDWSFTTTTDSSDAAEPDTSVTPGVHTSRLYEPNVQTTSVGPHSVVSNRGSEDASPAAPHFMECDGDPQWSAHAALLLDAAMENRFIPPHVVS